MRDLRISWTYADSEVNYKYGGRQTLPSGFSIVRLESTSLLERLLSEGLRVGHCRLSTSVGAEYGQRGEIQA